VTLVLVRHGSAGDADTWEGDDRLRPLDGKGRKQAARLVEVLADPASDGS
jgi:8-oxo-dGTP diphosphatase